MQKFIKTFVIVCCLISFVPLNVKAGTSISINELIEHAKEFDGHEFTIQGEAIGERMDRGKYTWININDGTNAIGIWMKKSDAEKVRYYGNYKNAGDTIKITGKFYRACKEHGGEADFHCSSMKVVKTGHNVQEQVSSIKITASGILILISLSLLYLLKRNKVKA